MGPGLSNTFCIMPWVHLHIAQSGEVNPCCVAPSDPVYSFGSVHDFELEEIWNRPAIREFRKKQMEGKPDSRCNGCYEKENDGFRSLRNVTNSDYAHKLELLKSTSPEGRLDSNPPVYLDIRFSNVCNFKCRICGPWSSSQWHEDAVAMGMKNPNSPAISTGISQPEKLWKQVGKLIPDLEEIYFAGGEPLVMEEHYRFLDMLHEQKKFDIRLKYSTNLSFLEFKGRKVMELWKPFRQVVIAASLDGSGSRAEYMRKNQNWERAISIWNEMRKGGENLLMLLSPTVSVFNVLHICDFHREWTEKGLLDREGMIPSILRTPEIYDVANMPSHLKSKATGMIHRHLDWMKSNSSRNEQQMEFAMRQWEGVMGRIKRDANPSLWTDFSRFTARLDQLRGEDFQEVFPELFEVS